MFDGIRKERYDRYIIIWCWQSQVCFNFVSVAGACCCHSSFVFIMEILLNPRAKPSSLGSGLTSFFFFFLRFQVSFFLPVTHGVTMNDYDLVTPA